MYLHRPASDDHLCDMFDRQRALV